MNINKKQLALELLRTPLIKQLNESGLWSKSEINRIIAQEILKEAGREDDSDLFSPLAVDTLTPYLEKIKKMNAEELANVLQANIGALKELEEELSKAKLEMKELRKRYKSGELDRSEIEDASMDLNDLKEELKEVQAVIETVNETLGKLGVAAEKAAGTEDKEDDQKVAAMIQRVSGDFEAAKELIQTASESSPGLEPSELVQITNALGQDFEKIIDITPQEKKEGMLTKAIQGIQWIAETLSTIATIFSLLTAVIGFGAAAFMSFAPPVAISLAAGTVAALKAWDVFILGCDIVALFAAVLLGRWGDAFGNLIGVIIGGLGLLFTPGGSGAAAKGGKIGIKTFFQRASKEAAEQAAEKGVTKYASKQISKKMLADKLKGAGESFATDKEKEAQQKAEEFNTEYTQALLEQYPEFNEPGALDKLRQELEPVKVQIRNSIQEQITKAEQTVAAAESSEDPKQVLSAAKEEASGALETKVSNLQSLESAEGAIEEAGLSGQVDTLVKTAEETKPIDEEEELEDSFLDDIKSFFGFGSEDGEGTPEETEVEPEETVLATSGGWVDAKSAARKKMNQEGVTLEAIKESLTSIEAFKKFWNPVGAEEQKFQQVISLFEEGYFQDKMREVSDSIAEGESEISEEAQENIANLVVTYQEYLKAVQNLGDPDIERLAKEWQNNQQFEKDRQTLQQITVIPSSSEQFKSEIIPVVNDAFDTVIDITPEEVESKPEQTGDKVISSDLEAQVKALANIEDPKEFFDQLIVIYKQLYAERGQRIPGGLVAAVRKIKEKQASGKKYPEKNVDRLISLMGLEDDFGFESEIIIDKLKDLLVAGRKGGLGKTDISYDKSEIEKIVQGFFDRPTSEMQDTKTAFDNLLSVDDEVRENYVYPAIARVLSRTIQKRVDEIFGMKTRKSKNQTRTLLKTVRNFMEQDGKLDEFFLNQIALEKSFESRKFRKAFGKLKDFVQSEYNNKFSGKQPEQQSDEERKQDMLKMQRKVSDDIMSRYRPPEEGKEEELAEQRLIRELIPLVESTLSKSLKYK